MDGLFPAFGRPIEGLFSRLGRAFGREMSAATGRSFEYRDIAPQDYAAAMREQGHPESYIALLLELYEGIAADTKAQLRLGVQEALDRQPISFARFCRDHAEELVRQL